MESSLFLTPDELEQLTGRRRGKEQRQQLDEQRRDAHENQAAAACTAVKRARRNWAQQGSAEYSELVVTDEMVAAAEEAYMPFGDMRLALETALSAVVRTD